MSRLMDQPVKTFSVGFEHRNGKQDELPYARQVSQQYGTDHHVVIMRPQYFMDLAENVTWHLDQPIADQATLAMNAVSELASKHVKMVLTGEGGDELFAGYARYYGERFSTMFKWIPGPLKFLALAASSRIPRRRRQKIALYALCQRGEASRFTNWFPLFNSSMISELVAGTNSQIDDSAAHQSFRHHLQQTDARHPLNRMLYVDTKLWLPDFLLMRGDKMSMANSLEARVPLLDHKLVEFAATLPPKLKLNGLVQKYLLKQVGRRYLPTEIIDRKKEGFPIPISSWFRHEMKPFVRDMLAPETIMRRGLFNPSYVQRLIEQHESRFADHGALLWGLISLEIWYRIYIDSPPRNIFRPKIVTAST
jgi:asparagine synthase (glutamine-hydrolysing)